MSASDIPVPGPGVSPDRRSRDRAAATRAFRGAWWSVALYPVSFVAAFVVGEGLLSMVAADTADPADVAWWQAVLAGTPALLLFIVPGLLAMIGGRRAMRLGRADGKVPAAVGAAIAVGFVGVNVMSYLLGLILE